MVPFTKKHWDQYCILSAADFLHSCGHKFFVLVCLRGSSASLLFVSFPHSIWDRSNLPVDAVLFQDQTHSHSAAENLGQCWLAPLYERRNKLGFKLGIQSPTGSLGGINSGLGFLTLKPSQSPARGWKVLPSLRTFMDHSCRSWSRFLTKLWGFAALTAALHLLGSISDLPCLPSLWGWLCEQSLNNAMPAESSQDKEITH